jgi:glycosyltransferase involved in cell wall biosynthesis
LANIFSGIIGKNLGVKSRIASQRNPPQIYGKVVRFLDKYIGSRGLYTANICNSQAGMDAFENYPESYKKHLSVINNCVEPADLSLSKEEAKKKLNIDPDKLILTCVGRLHNQKNHELLVNTMKHVDNAILHIAGDGPLKQKIINQINLYKIQDKIVLMGDLEREQVRLLLRATDIFLIPSKYEGLSNSLIEAMSYGLPVVFSDIPSFTDFLKLNSDNEYAGILANNDENEWAKAIGLLINDKDLMKKYHNLSLERVADLTPEKMTERFMKLMINKA